VVANAGELQMASHKCKAGSGQQSGTSLQL
jgi:hypothetical protein